MGPPGWREVIVVAFALEFESIPLRRALRRLPSPAVRVWHTGLGAECAARAVDQLAQTAPPMLLISAGLGAGLDGALSVGDVIVAANRTSPGWIERFRALDGIPRVVLATSPEILRSPEAKQRFRRQTGAAVADMETAAVSEGCAHHGIPLLALRAISDAAHTGIPLPNNLLRALAAGEGGATRRLAAFLLRHPAALRPVFALAAGSFRARASLTRALLGMLAPRRV